MDDYERRYAAALAELKAAGVWSSSAEPLTTLVARRLGSRPRPPHYVPFWKIVRGYGLWFAVIWGAVMWLTVWKAEGMEPASAAMTAAVAGGLFAVFMALNYAYARTRRSLSEWQDL